MVPEVFVGDEREEVPVRRQREDAILAVSVKVPDGPLHNRGRRDDVPH